MSTKRVPRLYAVIKGISIFLVLVPLSCTSGPQVRVDEGEIIRVDENGNILSEEKPDNARMAKESQAAIVPRSPVGETVCVGDGRTELAFVEEYYADDVALASEDKLTVRFKTAVFDFNGDGTEEIIVYKGGTAFCGSLGCSMTILQKGPEGSRREILEVSWGECLELGSDILNGYHTLVFHDRGRAGMYDEFREGTALWAFDGNRYAPVVQ